MTPTHHQFAAFRLDAVNQCLWRGAEQISLSPKAFAVLFYLADRPGRLVTKQELLDAVWSDIHVTEGVLKRAVLEIRKALADPVEEPRFIQTLHRRGYRFLTGGAEKQTPAEHVPGEIGVVGRAGEFQQLDEWFEDAVESSRQIVFISGEAGLGKTTLVDAWMRNLRARGLAADRGGVALARGRCLQQFGSGEPYLPVFEALEQLSQTLGRRLVEHLRSRAPTWLLHMPALISLEDRVRLRDEVFGSTRERMLREITDALESLSGERPLVVALEDLHWSDPSTIDLLSSIARRTSPARLMILATYRPSDAAGNAASLLGTQNELELHRQCKVMPLAYLSESATAEYLAGRFPDLDSTALASALHRRTNGNPLYIVCLVDELERSGIVGADPEAIRELVPETLQQMFARQASQLTGAEQEMLDMGAAAGESFSVAAVANALGRDGAEIEFLCETLVRRNIILKRTTMYRYPDGSESPGYSFLHGLCRDALYRRISPGRRSRVHGLLGKADEQLYASDPKRVAAQLAGHFEFAGDFARAIQYLRKAAETAAGRYSNKEAVQYLDRAFGMTDRLRECDHASVQMDLLEQRAHFRLIASDMPGALSDLRGLAELARLSGAVARRIRALLESVPPLLFLDFQQMLAVIEEAGNLQLTIDDPILGAIIDVYRVFFGMFQDGWSEELADLLRRAMPNLNPLTDLPMRSRMAWMAAAAYAFCDDFSAACEKAEESRQLSRKTGVYFDYFVATLYLNGVVLRRGDLGQAMRIAKDGAELAAKNGSLMPSRWLTMRQMWARLEAFDFEGALPTCEQIALDPLITSHRPNRMSLLWVGLARLGVGNYDGAWDALEKLRVAVEEGGISFQAVCPMLHAQSECMMGLKDLAHARTLAQQLIEAAAAHHEFSYVAAGHRLLAEIDSAESNYCSAGDHITQALEALEQCEAWNVEWQVHATAAHIFTQLGLRQESDESREQSLQVAQRIAATLMDEPALQQSFLKRVTRELTAQAHLAAGL